MSISVRYPPGPAETRGLDTNALRDNFLVADLFAPGEIRMTYWHEDRSIAGGVVPGGAPLVLEASKQVGSSPFLARREMGIVNVGGPGEVSVDGQVMAMNKLDCLYLPMGTAKVGFGSDVTGEPAQYYFISTPAHARHEMRLITQDQANRLDLGSDAEANRRVLRQYIHPDICQSCQLLMGITAIETGSVWNTMPAHTHDRRSEIYLYFDMAAESRIFHMMGEPGETRHLVVANQQAVLSPSWSVHCGAGTGSYTFIWAMAGDNQDFTDMDMIAMQDLR